MNNLVTAILLFLFSAALPVYGYIDPGTGSYVFQILIASLLAVSFVVRRFWEKIRFTFSRFWKKIRGRSDS